MRISANLCALALKQLVGGACRAVGVEAGEGAVQGVVGFLMRHFTDHSKALLAALESSNERAWKALEVALAGDSLLDRCKLALASGEDRAFREAVRPFLDSCSLAEMQGRDAYRQACLAELRAARKAGLLAGGALEPAGLARQAGAFARYARPEAVLDAEMAALAEMGDDLRAAGHANLAAFVALRPRQGQPLLLSAVRYFFRRAVETDQALFQGLTFSRLEQIREAQDDGFASLGKALDERAEELERVLADVQAAVLATRDAVLDVREEQRRQGEQSRDIYRAVLELQNRLDLAHREVRPRDSLSLRNDQERALVKQLVARYRGLPEGDRRQMPALLNAIGKLEVAAGDFRAAQQDFAGVLELTGDPRARAEAHANAYRAALERRDWEAALRELREAVRLDPARFSPFPTDKYRPQRILGAGGFGVAFLCEHRFLKAPVVVKTLADDDIDRDIDAVFGEAQVLRQLDHPAIIRLQDCGFGGPDGQSRPYLVMDYFEGQTLEECAREQPLAVADLVRVAGQVASGLRAAHGQGILHRDVKPANLLVRRPAASSAAGAAWEVKLIDFGLALRRTGRETMAAAASATLAGSSIAGTIDYAAPEQMGKLPGVAVAPYSDVYGFARTCCYALFGTPQPLMRHWRGLPAGLAELLESCLEEKPDARPQDFGKVLAALEQLRSPAPAPASWADAARPLAEMAGLGSVFSVLEQAVAAPAAPAPPAPPAGEARRQELEVVSQQVAACTRCAALVRSRSRTVFGAGPVEPELCFIGEAPGADEDRTGQPFVGAGGQVLNQLLREAGIERSAVYITNLLKCRPPNNRKPEPAEVQNCRAHLVRELEVVRPKAIICLGAPASQGLLGTSEFIGRLRGRVHDFNGTPVVCTYHPAFLLPGRSPERKGDVIADIRLALDRLKRAGERKQ
jgi:uracil-DNA glycosylase family 4